LKKWHQIKNLNSRDLTTEDENSKGSQEEDNGEILKTQIEEAMESKAN